VGAADALEDERFLKGCFVDTGELEILRDTHRPECIVLGRTGSGKTALLARLCETEENVVQIAPESLARSYAVQPISRGEISLKS
jgi:Flp pilus assembly CpaF family ATPase